MGLTSMLSNIATVIVAWIVFVVSVKIAKMTIKTAFILAAGIVILDVGFGISPRDIWLMALQLPQYLSRLIFEYLI
jgi:hypothetical protein